MTRVWCGVDLGSTNVKVVAVDEGGRVRSRVSRPTPRLDAEGLFGFVERMVVAASEAGHSVAGVCVAGVGEDGTLLSGGRPVGPVVPWSDPARAGHVPALATDVPRYGTAVDAARTVTAWAMLAREHPSEVASASTWLAMTDYPAFRWSGREFMSDTLATRTAAWNRRSRTWDPNRLLVEMPDVVPAGTVLGELRSETLHDAGVLEPGALVVAGGHDHPVAASLVQRQDPGAVLDSMGTAEVVVRTVKTDVPGFDLSPGVLSTGVTALRVLELDRNLQWARATSPAVAAAVDAVLSGVAAPHGTTPDLFVPGAQGGETPRWTVDPCDVPPLDLARSALVALAATGAATIRALGPDAPAYAAGGWTSSPGWMRIKESTLPYRTLDEPQLTARAAAHLALLATGHHPAPLPVREPATR